MDNPILEQALEYHRRGWSIIPIKAGTKKPAIRSWKQYQTKRPTEAQIRMRFSKGNNGIAVVVGEVSNGLACRDFDTMDEYRQWAQKHPALAKQLPTVKTSKGMHVYFEGHIKGIKHIQNGELRGSGGYCLLPPSIHPDGHKYQWLNQPNGSILAVDPELAGFIPKDEDVTEQVEQSEQYQQVEQTEAIVCSSIKDVINKYIVKQARTRNTKVWHLVRELAAFEELKDAGTADLENIHSQWFKKSKSNMEADYDESWFAFLYAWERVIFPKGVEMAHIFERAKKATVPEFAKKYPNPKKKLLVCWCRELQRQAGRQAFWLSARTAAHFLEITPMTAWRYLFVLIREKVLEEVEKGGTKERPRKATRFRYIAN